MKPYQIMKYHELCDSQKRELIEILVDGFGHLMNFTKDKDILRELFFYSLNQDYFFAYVEENTVLGFVGIATNKIRPVKFDKNICINLFGKGKGTILCMQMNSIFQSKVVTKATDLYIDFLATSKEARGKGIATKLLTYCFQLPNYKDYYIEVLSQNITAKKLYEKLGFHIYTKQYFSIISSMGFGYPIKMKKLQAE